MKKLFILLMVLVFASSAFATATVSVTDITTADFGFQKIYKIRVKCLMGADADNPDEVILTTLVKAYDPNGNGWQGGYFIKACTIPDVTAAPTTYTLALDDENGADLPITVTSTSTTQAECFYPTDTVFIFDLQLDFPDIGDAGDIGYVDIYILK